MKNFKQLIVWQKGMLIVKLSYQLIPKLPLSEKFNLASQIGRAAVSIPANIAEGSSRKSEKDYFRFIEIALGSAFELEVLLLITVDNKFLSQSDIEPLLNLVDEEQKMLMAFMKKLRAMS